MSAFLSLQYRLSYHITLREEIQPRRAKHWQKMIHRIIDTNSRRHWSDEDLGRLRDELRKFRRRINAL